MRRHSHITGFYIETLLLVLVFIAIILSLTGVFGMARRRSAEARLLTNAVTLSQNAAEALAASDSPETLMALLDERDNALLMHGAPGVTASYDADMRPDPKGALRVDVSWQPEETDAGTLVRSVILTRWNGGEEPLYRLETAVYLRGVTP